jgi:N-acetyl-anhydromuramyl-L-alanine amidase AmpD
MKSTKRFRTLLITALTPALLAALPAAATPAHAATTAARYDASGKITPAGGPTAPLLQLGGRGAGPRLTPSAALGIPSLGAPSVIIPQPECPPGLKCKFVPAAYQQDDPADKSNYGNYDLADRPSNGPGINTIVIHDTEGSLQDTLKAFQDPTFYASAHYIIDTDGTVYQTVQTKNIAWHAGNWYVNEHSIGIEHVGHAATGSTDYTPAMYNASARLVRYLATKYNIPLDRQHLLGHDNVTAPTTGLIAGMHTDPGPFWNWQLYLAMIGVPVKPTATPGSPLLTIAPAWGLNQPPLTDCTAGPCDLLPDQPANFVYLHTAPSDTAPLLSDPALHPDHSAGTTSITDWSARAVYGQQFAVADRQDDWVAIWYGGQKGWFRNPGGIVGAMPARGQSITPRAGLTTIPVYGRAYPEATAYAGTQVPVQAVTPLQYTIAAGQTYVTTGTVPTDYYWAWTIDSSLPDDHTLITGQDHYLEIQFNGRNAYVKAADVTVSSN